MKRMLTEAGESVRIAVEQVGLHKMRSLLTTLGVVIGIVAVTLMGTAIKGIDVGFEESLSMIGKDLFYVERMPWKDVGDNWRSYRHRKPITPANTERMNELIEQTPNSQLLLAVPANSTWRDVWYGEKSVSGVQIIGTKAAYILTSTKDFSAGRFFTEMEEQSGTPVVVLGADLAEGFFPNESPLGKKVRISRVTCTVVGVFARQGQFLGLFSTDKQAVMPLLVLRKIYTGTWGAHMTVLMRPDGDKQVAREEIEGHMRVIRGLQAGQPNDFEINQTETVQEQIDPIKKGIAVAGLFITGLSLFVGAIGIMNITFVSVKERTREIGTRRALGARRRSILFQFLVEAVTICLIGGALGLLFTFGVFQGLSRAFPKFPMVFSPDLVVVALLVSVAVGVFSGFAPALAASKLDPAEALRHE